MSDLNEVNSHLANSSSKIMITEEETANGLLSCILQIRFYSAGCHLQRTGDTMAPSKGGHFSGRHRLACAAHGLENLYHSLLFVILHQLLLVFGQRLQPDLIIWREWYIFALTTSVYCCFYTLFGT